MAWPCYVLLLDSCTAATCSQALAGWPYRRCLRCDTAPCAALFAAVQCGACMWHALDQDSQTPLVAAVHAGCLEVVALLVAERSHMHYKVQWAAQHGSGTGAGGGAQGQYAGSNKGWQDAHPAGSTRWGQALVKSRPCVSAACCCFQAPPAYGVRPKWLRSPENACS